MSVISKPVRVFILNTLCRLPPTYKARNEEYPDEKYIGQMILRIGKEGRI